MRTSILTALQTSLNTLTNFKVSLELPWSQSGEPLYLKNKRAVYVDQEYRDQSLLIPTLDYANVYQTDIKLEIYLAVDAKNQPAGLDSVITNILAIKGNTGEVVFAVESDYKVETREDVLIYTFAVRANTITI